MEQRLTIQQTGQLFATMTVRVAAPARSPALMMVTPLGIYLPAGVMLHVAGQPSQTLELQSCDATAATPARR